MNTTVAHVNSSELQDVLREANRLWRRAGVRSADRKALIAELEAEISGAHRDGHSVTSVLGDDSSATLRQWADEQGLCGHALRLGVVIPAALLGIIAGLAVVLLVLFAGFSGSPTIDVGPFVLPLYASAGFLAYLCALLCVWGALRQDPQAASTVRQLSVLLPIGAVLSTGAGMAIAWWRNFNTTPIVFTVVIAVVIVALGATVGLARYKVVRMSIEDRHSSASDIVDDELFSLGPDVPSEAE